MNIRINGETKEVPEGMTVQSLLDIVKAEAKYVAVAVNTDFVPRSEHAKTKIMEGDDVEIVSPQSGG
ncbi:MAG: sulfur carrier protein ThiS [Nitrospinae bacterium]|nr:sulfur carrier protein ThiS [Nitrospinota bacterium]